MNEFKIKSGLVIGNPSNSQAVLGITDSSNFGSLPYEDSSALATVNAIKNYIGDNVYGTDKLIPFSNSAGDGFDYHDYFNYEVNGNTNTLNIGASAVYGLEIKYDPTITTIKNDDASILIIDGDDTWLKSNDLLNPDDRSHLKLDQTGFTLYSTGDNGSSNIYIQSSLDQHIKVSDSANNIGFIYQGDYTSDEEYWIPHKKYVDAQVISDVSGNYLPITGGTLTGALKIDLTGGEFIRLDYDTDKSGYIAGYENNLKAWQIGDTNDADEALVIQTINDQEIRLRAHGVNIMSLGNHGIARVGIRTSDPSVELDVVGDGKFSGSLKKGGYEVLTTNDSLGTVTSVATTGPITGGTFTTSGTIAIDQADTDTDGYLSQTDWDTFNNKTSNVGTVTSISTTSPINGGTISGSGTISHSTADGYKHLPSGGAAGYYLQGAGSGAGTWTQTSSITDIDALTLQTYSASAFPRKAEAATISGNWNHTGTLKVGGTNVLTSAVTSIATTGPITGGTITGTGTIAIDQADTDTDGYLSQTDWDTFNNKTSNTGTVTSVGTNAPLTGTVTGSGNLSINQASTSVDGYLSQTDWDTFNNKTSNVGTVTSVATSGAITGGTITGSGTITHSTASGYVHLPSGGAAGYFLKGAGSGAATWQTSAFSNTLTGLVPITGAAAGNVGYFLNANNAWATAVTSIATTGPITGGTITGTGTIAINQASTSVDGYLSQTDWDTFNNKTSNTGTVTSIATTGPITGGTITGSGTIAINQASTSVDGYLSQTDWDTFNNKTSNTGTVTSVGTNAPLTGTVTGSGNLSINQAATSADGYLSSADWNTFNNKTSNTGTVTSVATTGAITGGTITGSGTISHSTAAGHVHLPTNGADAGYYLQWSSAGTGTWTGTSTIADIDALTLQTYSASAFPRKAEAATISGNWNHTGTLKVGGTNVLTSAVTSVGTNAPLTGTVTGSGNLSITQATTSTDGYLSQTDWDTFNNKTSNTGTVTSVATTGAITGGTITGSGTITHSTAAGYNHLPTNGADTGYWLRWASNGVGTWIDQGQINAGQVDGLSGSQFIRSDAADTATGILKFSSQLIVGSTLTPGSILDVNGTGTASGSISAGIHPEDGLMVTTDNNQIDSVQFQNLNTGTGAEMRFIATNNNNDYLAFTQPSSNNTGTFFGQTKSTSSFIFANPLNLTIGTYGSKDLIFGTGNTERVRVYSSGDVKFTGDIRVQNGSAASPSFTWTNDTDTGFFRTTSGRIGVTTNGTERFRFDVSTFHADGDLIGFSTSVSDRRLKENILPIETLDGLEAVLKLNPVKFNYKKRSGDHLGFIAQDIEKIIPEVVIEHELIGQDGVYKMIRYEEIIPYVTAATQELNKRIDKQDIEIYKLKEELTELKKLIHKIIK